MQKSTFPISVFWLCGLLVACSSPEPEVVTTSVDVDHGDLPALFDSLDNVTDDALPKEKMLELALSTPMDDELQQRFNVVFKGADAEIQLHVWREQANWVHLYFSSTAKDLVAAIESSNSAYARETDE